MTDLQTINQVFGVFHDAGISGWVGNKEHLTLEIDCTYLAERIDPSYRYFFIELKGINKLQMDPWINSDLDSTILFTEFKEIFAGDLEMVSSQIEGDCVLVTCYQHDKDLNYSGGNLYVDCKEIQVYDQSKMELTLNALIAICKGYWDNFGTRK